MLKRKLQKIAFLVTLAGLVGFSPHLAKNVEAKTAKNPVGVNSKMQAFCYSNCKNGSFREYVNKKSDANGFKISNFSADFNYANKKLKCKNSKGKTVSINLAEKCGTNKGAPYRYYFWVKSNKLKNPNSVYWYTEYFIGTKVRIKEGKGVESTTGKPLEKGTYNANQKGVGGTKVNRLEVVPAKGTFCESEGKTQYANGAAYGITLYVIDIKDWYEKNSKDGDGYTGNIYLQSITKIYNPNGTPRTEELTTLASWWDAATKNCFTTVGKQAYYQHYNQWIELTKIPHTTIFHRIQADEEHPIAGNKNKPVVKNAGGEIIYDTTKIAANSGFLLINTPVYTDASGQKWYLKGVRITNQENEGTKEQKRYQFYVLDKIGNTKEPQITGTSNSTTKYSKKNYDGDQKNTIAGQKEFSSYGGTVRSVDKKQFTVEKGIGATGGYISYSGDYMTGKQKWRDLADYTTQIMLKTTEDITHVYLVYAKAAEPELTFNATYWTVKDGVYQCEDSSKVNTLGTIKGSTEAGKELKKALGNVWYGTLKKSDFAKFIKSSWKTQKNTLDGSGEYTYTLKKYRIHYYSSTEGKNGNRTEKTTDWYDLTDKVWDGRNGGADAIGQTALSKLKEVSIKDADFSLGVTVDLGYFQPLAPSKMKVYLKTYNDTYGSVNTKLVSDSYTPSVSTGGETRYDKVSSSVSCIRPTAKASYSSSSPSFSAPSGYHVTKSVSLAKSYVVEGDVGGYLGANSDCVQLRGNDVIGTAAASGLSFEAGYSGRIAVAIYEVHYEKDPPPPPPGGPAPEPPPTCGHYEVKYHLATAIGGKIPAKDSSEWVDAGYRESAVGTTNGAKVNVSIPGSVNGGTIYASYSTSSNTSH